MNPLSEIIELDARGWLIGVNETADVYRERVTKAQNSLARWREYLRNGGEIELAPKIKVRAGDEIQPEFLATVHRATQELYEFNFDAACGFYLATGWEFYVGGCAFFDREKNLDVFLLREHFRTHEKYLRLYSRQEILTHEICHTARTILANTEFEEYFAYQTSPSKLRRYLGNAFRGKWDSIMLLFACLMAFFGEAISLFTPHYTAKFLLILPLLMVGGWLLLRNHLAHNVINNATRNLQTAGLKKSLPLLFRCTDREIHEIAKLKTPLSIHEYLKQKSADNLRWQVISARFGIS